MTRIESIGWTFYVAFGESDQPDGKNACQVGAGRGNFDICQQSCDKRGFAVEIYTFDHEPAHVHIWKAEVEVVINLGKATATPAIRGINGMKKNEVRKAYSIVEKNLAYLRESWRQYHG